MFTRICADGVAKSRSAIRARHYDKCCTRPGVPLFQEQAMKVAMVAADLSRMSHQLRRGDGGVEKIRRVMRFHQKIIDGMLGNGYTRPSRRGHVSPDPGLRQYVSPNRTRSFALLVYVSAWLKRHHPAPSARPCSTASRGVLSAGPDREGCEGAWRGGAMRGCE